MHIYCIFNICVGILFCMFCILFCIFCTSVLYFLHICLHILCNSNIFVDILCIFFVILCNVHIVHVVHFILHKFCIDCMKLAIWHKIGMNCINLGYNLHKISFIHKSSSL